MSEVIDRRESRDAQKVGRLAVEVQLVVDGSLYDSQIEAAAIRLSPTFIKLREAEELRQELNRKRRDLNLNPDTSSLELEFKVAEGMFLVIDRPIPYVGYLQDRRNGFSESARRGVKNTGDIVFFTDFKLRGSTTDEVTEVEMEILEYPDKSLADILVPPEVHRSDSHYVEYNRLLFNPELHRIGSLDYEPQIAFAA